MIVEIGEQLAVLLEPFVQPGAICGIEVAARGFIPYDQVRTLEVAHSKEPIYSVPHSPPATLHPAARIEMGVDGGSVTNQRFE